MQKSRTEIKLTVKAYPLHGLTKVTHVLECVFLISIQLLSISLDAL